MKATFFAALVAAASAKPLLHQIESYTFADLVEEFNLDFTEGTQEFEIRSAIFEIERARVVAHNKSGASWKENVNHMSHLTGSEKKAFLGRTKGRVPVSQFQKENKTEQLPLADLPASVDWRDAGVVSAVKDQGHCGSCWAFASTATIESHAAINSGELFDLSTQQVAACAANTDECGGTGNCNGATAEIAFAYVASSEGLLEEFEYPYTEYYGIMSQCAVPAAQASKVQISGYVHLAENGYSELMNAVATIGPMSVSVDASDWHAYESGIFNGCNQTTPDINHVVVLIGYGTDNGQGYWLVRNSWSASWGEAGYIRLFRNDQEGENCGLDVTPLDGSGCVGDDDPVTTCGTCGILYDSSYPTGAQATSSANSFLFY